MSASTAIGRVSESLRNLLLGEMSLAPTVPVTILGPDETGGARRINLFLYRVQENPFLRNADWQPSPSNPGQLVPPPLSLRLFYLLTPYASNDSNLGNATVHEILGEAMRVFHEFPVVPAEYLAGDLDDAREELRITPNGVNMEELGQIWSTFQQPFRLSVLYEVSVVQLDLSSAAQRTVPERVREIGVPQVEAPFRPPVVEAIEPADAPAGSVVTFTGTGLDGWSGYVRVGRRVIADGVAITGDSFDVTLPNDLAIGFHELRVDVSHLYRRTFVFEVTP
ncbi:MAG TPA: DUF4255 domain-containing protein [Longimicrobium sp.]|nr:DUF4255 domain-containing protein [Longimicrobium sp.]